MSNVLVVDDEYGIADLIQALLSDEGHDVIVASNGRQGLAALAVSLPDLVFLDYMMPVMDGATMLREMSRDGQMRDIPVVLMSSLPEATVAHLRPGYTAFMRKPFKIAEVIAHAARLLPHRADSR